MLRFFMAAIAGAACCSLLPAMPSRNSLLWLTGLALASGAWRSGRLVSVGVGGLLLYAIAAGQVLDLRLPQEKSGKEFRFNAQIVDFTRVKESSISMLVAPRSAGLTPRVRLNWYHNDAIPRLGEHWEFRARLRRPRGSRNPGGFDYAGWLHRERIGATGYIVSARRLKEQAPGTLHSVRRDMATRIVELLPAGDARAALLAISLGARHQVSRDAWGRYAATGTSHLMAISGLHIGLAASGASVVAWGISALFFPRINLRDVALLAALIAAAAYTAVSGFAVPSQRALLMAVCAAACLWLRVPTRAGLVLAAVATLILAIDPLSILAPGFLLSFGAVALLLHVAGMRPEQQPVTTGLGAEQWARQLGTLQAALLLGLLPLTAILFWRTAWLAPLANLIVLPAFSLITVPAALLGVLLAGPAAAAGDTLLWLAWYSLRAAHGVIDGLASLPSSRVSLARPEGAARLLLLLPVIWVVLPRGFPGRYLAWLSFAAVLFYRPADTPTGCADVHTLDVGQGLAMVVRTQNRTLLYDTGPAYRGSGSSVESVIFPFLASQGVHALDAVVVSHADQDHAGGIEVLLSRMPVDRLLSGERLPTPGAQEACIAGQRWRWDGVHFEVLYPHGASAREGNNASCVVRISVGDAKIILTGDIEARVERELAAQGSLEPVMLAQVPHHGSRTSSSNVLVRALAAKTAIVSAGYGNRWGFPKNDVVGRWQAAGTRVLNTATSGAIHHRVCPESGLQLVSEHRKSARRYWHDDKR